MHLHFPLQLYHHEIPKSIKKPYKLENNHKHILWNTDFFPLPV